MREKKIKGIKRHFLVDVLGLLLCIVVHAANVQERAGARLVFAKAAERGLPRLQGVLADDGYSGAAFADEVQREHGWTLASVKRTELHRFAVIPKRWVVERTIGWMNNWRGLSKHYDYESSTGEAKILLASIFYLTRRLGTQQATPMIDTERDKRLRQLTNNATHPT